MHKPQIHIQHSQASNGSRGTRVNYRRRQLDNHTVPTICRVWRPIVSGIYYKMWSGKWKTYALYQLHVPEEEAIKFGQNELLPISPKTSSKISIFWNYLAICPYFETRFFKKLSFNEKLNLMKNELLAKCFMELEFHVFFFFFKFFAYNLIF